MQTKPLIVLVILCCFTVSGMSQFVDLLRNPPYRQVFVETDDFDSSYLSQLEAAFYKVTNDSLKLALGNDLAYYWHTRNLDKALVFGNQVYALANSINNQLWLARIQVTLGAILLRQEKLDTAFLVLEQARSVLPQKEWPQLLTQQGYVMERKGLLGKAVDYALAALKLGDSLRNLKVQAMAYSDLSNLFWKQAKYQKGIEYGLLSDSLFRQWGINDMDYSFTLYVVGNNYLALKDYPNALGYYKRALAISERYQFYNNLADIYISLADLYTITYDYSKAESAARDAIRYSKLLFNNFMLMRSWLALGKMQNLSGQPVKAIQSLDTCLAVATKNFGDRYYLHLAYRELADAYSAAGNYKSANEAFLVYDQLKDSVFTADADQRVARLQTEFDLNRKETTIRSQELSILQQRRMQLLTLGAAFLLVIVLAVLFRNFRHKQALNTQLESLNLTLENKNAQLDKRNAENELLLKEIHHRVKNNLEVVSGLLALQAAQIDHPAAQAVMVASQNRVMSMGIIHQKLYQGKNKSALDMKDYFQVLADSILDSFSAQDRITVITTMQPLEMDVDIAVPIGLIANELITNSLKYAFPGNQPGEIRISLARTGRPDEFLFCVSDNGVGKPKDSQPRGTGFGTELVNLLVAQLDGRLEIRAESGTTVSILFKHIMPH